MNFIESLRKKAEEAKSIVCMGMDPVLERIPFEEKSTEETIVKFYSDILKAAISESAIPAIVKPNYAFYAQYEFEGLRALKKLIEFCKSEGIPVILDAKRGDIGKTSAAYAKEAFEFWDADAVTISPYMGSDSVMPFVEYCKKGKGVYILNRTSNKGAADFQNLRVGNTFLYLKVAEKIADWAETPGVGAVVGATSIQEFEDISRFFVKSEKEIPLLIPGVGAQGGSAKEITNALKKTENPLEIHRINSSSGVNYAYEEQETEDYAGAAVKAIKELNKEIGFG